MKFLDLLIFKMTGAGNDFLLVDAVGSKAQLAKAITGSRAEWVKQVCDRHFGLGADGVVFLEKASGDEYKWDFYNSDGSKAEMCGNAARCTTKFLSEQMKARGPIRVHTTDSFFEGECLSDGRVAIQLAEPTKMERAIELTIDGEKVRGDYIWAGVPHFVLQQKADKNLARKLRSHPHFQAHGSNITFSEQLEPHRINAVTYERGVEDFTLACGTGAVAAAFSQFASNDGLKEVKVKMPGGELTIKRGPPVKQIGPAEWIGKMYWRSL